MPSFCSKPSNKRYPPTCAANLRFFRKKSILTQYISPQVIIQQFMTITTTWSLYVSFYKQIPNYICLKKYCVFFAWSLLIFLRFQKSALLWQLLTMNHESKCHFQYQNGIHCCAWDILFKYFLSWQRNFLVGVSLLCFLRVREPNEQDDLSYDGPNNFETTAC